MKTELDRTFLKLLGAVIFIFFLTVVSCLANDDGPRKIRRFAFVVGKNEGGQGRAPLKYAASDAQAFSRIMEDLGGLDGRDSIVLLNPDRGSFLSKFHEIRSILARNRAKDVRSELFFYYSGHSDDEGLLLDGQRVTYRELKKEIVQTSADISVVVLDSCASGSFAQTKGGVRKPPFLEESLSKLKGYVVLTSSSAKEAAQESDRIKGSYFTHYLVSGLRGAADVTADNRVTLNEAYQYAFQQTLARTEKTLAGPQHPSYSIQLMGSGELVMTDIRNTTSRLVLEEKLLGRFYIRDKDEGLVAEIEKHVAKPMAVGLEPGVYSITSYRSGKIARAAAEIGPNHAIRVTASDFRSVEGEATTVRGDSNELNLPVSGDYVVVPAEFSVMPGVSSNIFDQDQTINYFHMSVLHARSARLKGMQLSLLGFNRVRQSVNGVQLAPGANFVDSGPLVGAQLAAGYNRANEVEGVQLAAGYNRANEVEGVQLAAGYNHASQVTGMQLGGFNRAAHVTGFQGGGLSVAESVLGGQMGAANRSDGHVKGIQVGGFNQAGAGVEGVQIGAANQVKTPMAGTQLGGVNLADQIKGAQIGAVNVANQMGGFQLGLVNKNKGRKSVPVGLVNIIEDGMYRLGYAFNEKAFHQLQFRHGSEYTYSVLQYGYRFSGGGTPAHELLGAGLGGQLLVEPVFITMEGVFNYVNRANTLRNPAWLTQVRLLPGWRITPKMSLSAGPTVNHLFLGKVNDIPGELSLQRRFWVGYQAGLEFWL